MKQSLKFFHSTYLISLIIFSSCSNGISPSKKDKIISVDSLNMLWNNAWNNQDSTGTVNLLAKDAILISGQMQIKGSDSISNKFVHHYIGKITDLQSNVLQTKAWEDMCYYTGTYSFNIIQSGKKIGKEEGVYSFIWEKQSDNTFKLSVLHMEEYIKN